MVGVASPACRACRSCAGLVEERVDLAPEGREGEEPGTAQRDIGNPRRDRCHRRQSPRQELERRRAPGRRRATLTRRARDRRLRVSARVERSSRGAARRSTSAVDDRTWASGSTRSRLRCSFSRRARLQEGRLGSAEQEPQPAQTPAMSSARRCREEQAMVTPRPDQSAGRPPIPRSVCSRTAGEGSVTARRSRFIAGSAGSLRSSRAGRCVGEHLDGLEAVAAESVSARPGRGATGLPSR